MNIDLPELVKAIKINHQRGKTVNHFTRNYICNDGNCPDDKRYLTILHSQYTVVKGKPKFVAMSCFSATEAGAIDKANSIIDGRAEAEIRRLRRIERARAAKKDKTS